MINHGAIERILRTITQTSIGLGAGQLVQEKGHIAVASTTGIIITIAAAAITATAMNLGPQWLRPLIPDIQAGIDEAEKTP